MPWLPQLPPRPSASRVAAWTAAVILARAALLVVYLVLGDLQDGVRGTLGRRLIDEFSASLTALPLLLVIVWGAVRWPLTAGRWRRSLLPLGAVFVLYSVAHTVAMETARWLLYPLVGLARDYSASALVIAAVHEMPNDLFYFALAVAALALWRFWWEASERERREGNLRHSLAEAQLMSLRLQLQPHFLFNALNTVSATMYDDPRRADAMIGELGELLRASLRADCCDEVALGEELEIALAYVRLQRARFGDRLTVTFDVPEECRAARVPMFVLQPLIENAVRHGRVERLGAGTIRVTARRNDGQLALEVWDDGDGSGGQTGGGLGLRSTAERLRLRYGGAAALVAGPVETGWRVRLAHPFRTEP